MYSFPFELLCHFHLEISEILKDCSVANVFLDTVMAEVTHTRLEQKPLSKIKQAAF